MSMQRNGVESPGTLERSPVMARRTYASARAKELGIAGRSTMGKEALARVIARKQR
jgi:hypothetical protein